MADKSDVNKDAFFRAVIVAVAGQVLLYGCASCATDMGVLARTTWLTFVPFWATAIVIYLRNPAAPSRLSLWFIRLGWILFTIVLAWPAFHLAYYLRFGRFQA